MNSLDFSQEPDLGYYFYPGEPPDHPGHPRLDIVMTARPTYEHFDPLKASFKVATRRAGINGLTVCHPWAGSRAFRVCSGRIILVDRQGKVIEAFSLGGNLQIEVDKNRTLCGLVSPAPIFPLFTTLDLPMWFTAEVEILLSYYKAQWNPRRPHDFEQHLAAIDPLQLYVACLQALQGKAGDAHCGSEQLDHEGTRFVAAEIRRLKEEGRWPRVVTTLQQYFSSDLQLHK